MGWCFSMGRSTQGLRCASRLLLFWRLLREGIKELALGYAKLSKRVATPKEYYFQLEVKHFQEVVP